MPWTVRTTKRKSRLSEPQPRKRQRLSFSHDKHTPGTVPKARQQTLTQIQFTPRLPSPLECDHTESIEPSAGPKSSKQPREPRELRARKGLKKQRSTLTQMNFLVTDRVHDVGGMEELGMITPDGRFEQEDIKATTENVNADTGKEATKPKRKTVGPAEGSSTAMKGKRRKTMDCGNADNQDRYDGTPRRRSQRGLNRKALSENRRGQNTALFIDEPNARFARAHVRARAELLEAKPPRRYIQDEKENLEPQNSPSRLIIPGTPKKPANVIPSSQSPESIPFSSRMRSNLCREQSPTSPLKERSTNIISTTTSRGMLTKGLSPLRRSLSPKKRICVLKYRPGLLKDPSLPEATYIAVDAGDSRPSEVVQSSTAQVENAIIPSTEDRRRDDSAFKVSGRAAEPGIPETSQMAQSAVIPSSQSDTEEEDEIPETSQGLRRFTSTSSAYKSEESLRMLSDTSRTPRTVKATSSIESLAQLGPGSVKADVQQRDFGLGPGIEGKILCEALSTTGQAVMGVSTADQRLPAQLLHKESIAFTIQDSENEDEDDDPGIVLCTRSPIADDTRPSADLARQSSTSTNLQPPSTDTPSSPTLPAVPLHTSYPSATTTRVPTKLPPSSSSAASSPSLPPPPPPQPRFTTQQSIRPASMPRPSQVSTQAATQQSWLHMSSTPFPYTCTTSSPTGYNHNAPEHLTIKDSSSIPIPLQDIPSQSTSQSQLQAEGYPIVDLGLGLDGDLDDRDDDLDPKSSQVMRLDQPNQQPEQDHRNDDDNNDHIRDQRPSALAPSVTNLDPHPANQHPLARLHLSESMLESLPGPPGWVPCSPSQGSGEEGEWDDRML